MNPVIRVIINSSLIPFYLLLIIHCNSHDLIYSEAPKCSTELSLLKSTPLCITTDSINLVIHKCNIPVMAHCDIRYNCHLRSNSFTLIYNQSHVDLLLYKTLFILSLESMRGTSRVLSKLYKSIQNLIDAQLKHGPFLLKNSRPFRIKFPQSYCNLLSPDIIFYCFTRSVN